MCGGEGFSGGGDDAGVSGAGWCCAVGGAGGGCLAAGEDVGGGVECAGGGEGFPGVDFSYSGAP